MRELISVSSGRVKTCLSKIKVVDVGKGGKLILLAGLFFLHLLTGCVQQEQEEDVLLDAIGVELCEAEGKGLIRVVTSGYGLEFVKLLLESLSADPLEVTILPGTILVANSPGTQSMVIREKEIVVLKSRGSKKSLLLKAACASMELAVPDEDDTFVIKKPLIEDLVKLLALPDFESETFRVQQFAIWTITDNPGRYDYVAIGTLGNETSPTREEMCRIQALFLKAGISTDKYLALRRLECD